MPTSLTRGSPTISPAVAARRPGRAHRLLAGAVLAAAGLGPLPAAAEGLLGSAQDFAVLAHDTVTNAHNPPNPVTQVYGAVGVTPGTAITGFAPTGVVNSGGLHSNDAAAQAALIDAQAAYAVVSGLAAGTDLTGQDLGALGLALTPGVYSFSSSAGLNGTLVLDFSSNPGGMFVFQIGSSLTTGSGSAVSVLNPGPQSGIYWQVGSSASLGSGSSFAGNVLAAASVSLDPGVQWLGGRALALGNAVTLIDNLITNDCVAGPLGSGCVDGGSLGFSGGMAVPIPEPATPLLMVAGLALLGWAARRRTSQPKPDDGGAAAG